MHEANITMVEATKAGPEDSVKNLQTGLHILIRGKKRFPKIWATFLVPQKMRITSALHAPQKDERPLLQAIQDSMFVGGGAVESC